MNGDLVGGMAVETIGRHVPFVCPYNHALGPGRVLVGWAPCQCAVALVNPAGGRGHRTFQCRVCLEGAAEETAGEGERWMTVCYLPPHADPGHPGR